MVKPERKAADIFKAQQDGLEPSCWMQRVETHATDENLILQIL